ncbi:MAG: helix-hairpin-helix domain-containing protein, partial [Firmicutes bacterium]|nr:helix-hairpin-helix domain-containing protein [Bacillota bacterium]
VNKPGVYRIPAGTRLFQVVEEAGGLKETADIDSINQAEAVTDGQKIIIGSRDENSPYYTGTSVKIEPSGPSGGSAVRQTADGFKVNLNRATLADLQMIPGVGPSTAQKILDYRESAGKFSSISDLKNISGIGEKTYDNLKDYIEV